MRWFIEGGLILFIVAITIYCYGAYRRNKKSKKAVGVGDESVNPLSNAFIIWLALVIAALVLFAFAFLYGKRLNIENNIGQIGDFVGGLINPALSFLGLLVLLRTTLIQTIEARKTREFMGAQQKLMEMEKFENTFFQLLARLENYCENHFRGADSKSDKGGKGRKVTGGDISARPLYSRRAEFNALPNDQQNDAVTTFISEIVNRDVNFGLFKRVGSVVDLIDGSVLPLEWKQKYAVILRDSMYPPERILCLHHAYIHERRRELFKKWRLYHSLKSERFAANVVELAFRENAGLVS
ncbi:hypothetical protein Q1J61_18570 [Pseudomonas putida]|uniref:hypothetical protein n=1 Tax=Pseudomonas putida TaxID=303 RepID=UPI0034D7973B